VSKVKRGMGLSESRTDAIDKALVALGAQARGSDRTVRRRRPWSARRILRMTAMGLALLVLPFLILVKVAVALYFESTMNPWLVVGFSAVVTTVLLTTTTMIVSYRLRRRSVDAASTFRFMGLLVASYCVYSVMFISGAHVKSAEVAETYRSLHPLLRLSISTLVLVDEELVVTDAARTPQDYTRMGLSVNESSLHLVQKTGYVHAVDLRTIGRSAVENVIVAGYFRAMGFRTLRHVGTADHLHVSLPVK